MLTAKEARNLKNTEPTQTEIDDIETKIIDAAMEGKTSFWYYTQLTTQMKAYLTKRGYRFDEQWDRNDYMVNISWEADK